jgi:hypothetical protein
MEGSFVRQLAVAYDLVHGTLGEDEGRLIERDLLLESTPLLLADPARNNKSVTNLTAAGLVGMAVGDPALVRAGASGFWHFVRHWFLPDGTTSESPAYGHMTLNGLWAFGEALHGYSDPPGFPGAAGAAGEERWDNVDVYRDARYRAVFRALYDTLLPDLRYPAFADSYVTTTLGAHYADLMVARYNLPEYRALLAELCGGSFGDTGGEYALFHRDPGLELRPDDLVTLRDEFFPALRLGYLRAGEDGRAATAILSASHWGVHHHRDSLNLTFFQRGHEVLTDLGYLWDRPDKDMTVRTPAHNLVVVDEAEQRATERGGTLHHFDAAPAAMPGAPSVKVVDCSSAAYAQAPLYRRRCILVDHGPAGAYLVDVFWVRGGATHDYLFHGPVPGFEADAIALTPGSGPAPYGLTNVHTARPQHPWRLTWRLNERARFTAWALPADAEEVIVGDGWGERGWGHFNTPDKKVDVPYVIRRRAGTGGAGGAVLASTFVSVFETYEGTPLVTAVRLLPRAPGSPADQAPLLPGGSGHRSSYHRRAPGRGPGQRPARPPLRRGGVGQNRA